MVALRLEQRRLEPVTENHTETGRKGGRPRAAGLDEAIRDAVWRLLSEVGYDGLTFDAVASRAGSTRPAIYRRYPNKRELVISTVKETVRRFEPGWDVLPDPRSELLAHLRGLLGFLRAGGSGIILTLAQSRRTDPELSAELDSLVGNDREFYFRALRRACGGALNDKLCAILVDSLIGTIIYRVAFGAETVDDADLGLLVDQAIATAKGMAATQS